MKTIETRSRVGADGVLRLNLPVNLPETEVDVVIVVQPLPERLDGNGHAPNGATGESKDEATAKGWPPGFFEQTFGCCADDPLERPEQGEYEVREELE